MLANAGVDSIFLDMSNATWAFVPTSVLLFEAFADAKEKLHSVGLDKLIVDEVKAGKKILGKGNHDFWWSTMKKHEVFFEKNGIEIPVKQKALDFKKYDEEDYSL